ncbi:MAG: hypothetical protein HC890_19175 [Chloroflexaceae bacterium]|nr:hypothetical protein [Chloroflexaceae bacterium]
MQMERPNCPPPTAEELQDLEKLRKIVEAAIADGKLTKGEIEAIRLQVRADGKVTFEELTLCRQLIFNKIDSGELEMEWSRFRC